MKLIRREFREWLEKHPDDEFIPCDGLHCPVAAFIMDVFDKDEAYVDEQCYWYDKTHAAMPPWATKFVTSFDALGKGPVLGSKAIGCLPPGKRGGA